MGNHVHTAPRSTRPKVLALAIAAAGLLVALAAWVGVQLLPVSPRVVEGWAQPNATGPAIGLHDSPGAERGEGYIIVAADWRSAEGP